ncbi:MAG: ABC transporter permease [Anaerolineae bacterium]
MKILAVFLNENKRLFREKGVIAILLLMPLAFIIPVGAAYSSGAVANEVDRPLLVIDHDGGQQAQDLIETLDENFLIERNLPIENAPKYQLETDPACAAPSAACDEMIARAQLKDSSRSIALLIPAGLSQAYAQSKQTVVTLLYDPAGDVSFRDQVQGVIKGAAISISLEKQVMQGQQDMADLSSLASDEFKDAVDRAARKTTPAADLKSAIAFEPISPTNYLERKPPNALQQTVPGYTVMFVFLVAGFMAGWSIEERQNGILRRLRSSPVSTASLLGGKLLYGLVVSLVQILVLYLVASVMFKLDLGHDLLAFLLVSAALATTVTCLGLLAAAIKFPGAAITAPLIIGALLGGCMFSPDFMPPWLRTISYFIPHTWAMTGYQDLLVRGQGLAQVLPEIGVLLLFAAIFFGIGVWRYDPLD